MAQRAELTGVDALGLEPATPVTQAWSAVCAGCGVSEEELANLVANHFRLAVADFGAAESKALKIVPERVARRYHVFPLREDDRRLTVATSDPTDVDAEQALGFISGRTPVFEVAPPPGLGSAIDIRYSPDRVLEGLLDNVAAEAADAVRIVEEEEEQAEAVQIYEAQTAPVVKLTNLILSDAIGQRASDIHIEPARSGGTVRFRVDGVLRQYMRLPMPALSRVVSRIKVVSNLDIADRLRPQDGRARIMVSGLSYDLRVSTVPTREAEKAVIRILESEGAPSLENLGVAADQLARLRRLLSHRNGVVAVTGPTGSGKTTTLYSAVRELATGEVNIMTVEDPVEYELPGITQIQVEPRRGVTFGSALRAILRQDPDVILVGEIRDLETAEIAVQASLTGHLVLATLHTNDAMGVITRLHDLGLDRSAIAESLRGCVAQRLVRRVCPDCVEAIAPGALTEGEERLAAKYRVTPVARGAGCERCGNTGYRGRVPVMEIAIVTPEFGDLVTKGASSLELARSASEGGMRPMYDVALDQVRNGTTTLEEVERSLGEGTAPTPAAADEGPLVLVVDDDAVNRRLARTLLKKNGYRVAEAADGVAAMERLAEAEYDLMILDLDMPKLGGEEVLQRVRSSVATAGLPVIVLTGTEDEDAERRVMEQGADDYIRKPIDPPRFLARIKAALRRAGG